jgi:hypothetical protein
MAIELSSLVEPTRKLSLNVTLADGDQTTELPLQIHYRGITPALLAQLDQKADETNSLAGQLALIITDLGIVKDGQPVPVSEELLGKIEVRVLRQIYQAIFDRAMPKKTTSPGSGDGT